MQMEPSQYPLLVIAGLDPAIQGPPRAALAALDARVKPGHDRKGWHVSTFASPPEEVQP
jgi:hypothetical protein